MKKSAFGTLLLVYEGLKQRTRIEWQTQNIFIKNKVNKIIEIIINININHTDNIKKPKNKNLTEKKWKN